MTLKQLTDEIGSKVQKLQEAARTPLHKQFLIAAVMADHDQIQGTDRPFALICVRYAVEQTVDRFFRDLKQKELETGAEVPEQLVFPGYERLQKHYITERGGVQVIVPVEEMSDDELRAKIAQHKQMGAGHLRHAEELQTFMAARRRMAAG